MPPQATVTDLPHKPSITTASNCKQHHRSSDNHSIHVSHHHAAQSHSFHSSISSLPSPLAPPILPQFVPPKPEKSTAVMVSQIATGGSTDGRCFGIDRTKQQQWQLTVYGSLVGSQSPPLVAPRGQKWHSSFACDTHSAKVSECPSELGGGS